MSKVVSINYDSQSFEVKITINGNVFDTSRIEGKDIEDWIYPFMIRKVKWNGLYDELVEADGIKEFNIIFSGDETSFAVLKEELKDYPIKLEMDNDNQDDVDDIVIINYNSKDMVTKITINGKDFDTSRIEGKEISDWIYPFMIRKTQWEGIFDELAKIAGSVYTIRLIGADEYISELQNEAPEGVKVEILKEDIHNKSVELENLAIQYDEEEEYEKSFELRKEAAELGNIVSLSNLGWHYHYGKGVEVDLELALNYYLEAADKGDAFSQCKTGFMYNNGYGCDVNESKAFKYFMKSAEQDFPEGQYWVGMCYKNGWGTETDDEKAFYWFNKSSENNYAASYKETAICLYNGIGCEENTDLAELYLMDGSEANDSEAMSLLGGLYLENSRNEDAFELLKKSYDLGNISAVSNLSICYEKGLGTQQNIKMAAQILLEYADQCPEFYLQLGNIYWPLTAPNHNYALAAQYYKKAADNDLIEGYYMMGLCYANGFGVPKDKEKGKEYLQIAMENGHEEAANTYNDMIKNEGYIETAKKIGGGLLNMLLK